MESSSRPQSPCPGWSGKSPSRDIAMDTSVDASTGTAVHHAHETQPVDPSKRWREKCILASIHALTAPPAIAALPVIANGDYCSGSFTQFLALYLVHWIINIASTYILSGKGRPYLEAVRPFCHILILAFAQAVLFRGCHHTSEQPRQIQQHCPRDSNDNAFGMRTTIVLLLLALTTYLLPMQDTNWSRSELLSRGWAAEVLSPLPLP